MAAAGFVASMAAHAQHAPEQAAVAQRPPPFDAPRVSADASSAADTLSATDPATDSATHAAVPTSDASPAWHAYLDANRRVLAGQADLAAAMGLTGAAGQAANAAGTLGSDDAAAARVSDTTLSQIGGAQQSVALALSQAFASTPDVPVDRDAFRTGLAALGEGLQRFEGLQQGGPASAAAATGAPEQIDAATSTLNDAVRYASLHGIDVPPVATFALRRITR